jgi:hypothetical protein
MVSVDVFDLDRTIVNDYSRFARSFTQIRAADIRSQVDSIYATERFWPEPLISINPHLERDVGIDALVSDGLLHPNTGRVFQLNGQSLTLYRHQAQAVTPPSLLHHPTESEQLVDEIRSAAISRRASPRRWVWKPRLPWRQVGAQVSRSRTIRHTEGSIFPSVLWKSVEARA